MWIPNFSYAAFLLFCLVAACSPRLRTRPFYLPEKTPGAAAEKRELKRPPGKATTCNNWQNYLPDPAHPDHLPQRLLRVNVHILNSRDSSHNFKPAEARDFITRLLAKANAQLDTNERNWRSPEGTPTLPKRYRYVLTPQNQPGDDGIYFHFDDELYYFISSGKNQNNYSGKVIDRYAVGLDSILNIFVLVHPDDSIRSKTYRANGQGIAIGNALKMAGLYESKGAPEGFSGLLNHEIGHILSLSHAWTEDGCPDTQNHPNRCWTWTPEGPCRDQATNNMMDYNAYQIALTPCQVGRIQAQFALEHTPVRRCLQPVWCSRRADREIVVRDSVAWLGARDLEGDLTISPGGALLLACRVSLPPDGRITVQPGGRLWLDGCRLHNACGKNWAGIFVQEKGDVRGEVHILQPPALENSPPGKIK